MTIHRDVTTQNPSVVTVTCPCGVTLQQQVRYFYHDQIECSGCHRLIPVRWTVR